MAEEGYFHCKCAACVALRNITTMKLEPKPHVPHPWVGAREHGNECECERCRHLEVNGADR